MIVPAYAGFYVMVPIMDPLNRVTGFDAEPVIAWEVLGNRTIPATIQGLHSGVVIMCRPDDTWAAPGSRDFESVQDAIDWFNREEG